MTAQELLEEIKDGLPATAWSSAVLCVRRGEVALFHRDGEQYQFDVVMGRPLPFRVELDLEAGDWSCPCRSPGGTCAHAAAAALCLQQSARSGRQPVAAPAPATERPRLGHRIVTRDGGWRLETVLIDPTDATGERPYREGTASEALVTAADRQVLSLQARGITLENLSPLLQALALCADVTVDGRPVQVSPEGVQPIVVVEDHPRGVRVRLGPRDTLHQTLPGRLDLVVVGTPPTLRPLGRSSLSQEQIDFYRPGRIYDAAALPRFLSEVLPRLRERSPVEMRTKVVPQLAVMPLYARLEITLEEGGLDALASVTYGDPPQAVVVRDRLYPLPGSTGVPHRQAGKEKSLTSRIEGLLGVPPGRRLQLRGLEAAKFASEVVPRFQGKVIGRELAERVRIHDAPLRPLWIRDAAGDPQLIFTLKGDARPDARGTGMDAPRGGDRGAQGGPEVALPVGRASAEEVLAAWREDRSLLPLLDGGFARLPADWMARYGALLEALLEASGDKEDVYKAPVMAQLMEAADTAQDLERIRDAVRQRQRITLIDPPATLQATLRGYQLQGLRWLAHQEKQGLGSILADDMGLGKTLQALALLLCDAPDAGPTLVVCPTSVLDNWRQEAARFAPSLTALVYHGGDRSIDELEHVHLAITSYGILRRDLEALSSVQWHRVILDEAQAIKNPDSQAARAARALPARHRLALTGTPIENRLQELWSLLEFLNPGMLGGRRAFEERYARPGEQAAVQQLRVRVQPFVLRRLKQEVARDLPRKTERSLKAFLTPAERAVYESVRLAGRSEVQKLLAQKGLKGSALQILEVLLRLRQACCHPALVPGAGAKVRDTTAGTATRGKTVAGPASRGDTAAGTATRGGTTAGPAPREDRDTEGRGHGGSSKIRLLIEELEVILEEGHKALVFSQWTSLLDLVEPALEAAGIGWVRLDGSTRDRAGVVARFQAPDGPGVFLISLKAGGTGLNLTAADYVFHLDPWWNPAVEDQATDRAYRIGQTRPVVATRLIAADTIEERVLQLQSRKRAVADAALGGDGGWLESLSEADIRDLLEA